MISTLGNGYMVSDLPLGEQRRPPDAKTRWERLLSSAPRGAAIS